VNRITTKFPPGLRAKGPLCMRCELFVVTDAQRTE